MAYISLNNIGDWLIKCVIYFVPILLMLARYYSFLVNYKKPMIDIVVDGQFCIIIFCMSMESILSLLKKWHRIISGDMKWIGIIIMIGLLVIAITILLFFWDLSYVSVQKEFSLLSKDKKVMMYLILFMLAATLILTFIIDVIIQ